MSTNQNVGRNRYASVSMSQADLLKLKRPDRPVWQLVEELLESIPKEVLDQLPTDGSEQHDHYIYGTPKRTE